MESVTLDSNINKEENFNTVLTGCQSEVIDENTFNYSLTKGMYRANNFDCDDKTQDAEDYEMLFSGYVNSNVIDTIEILDGYNYNETYSKYSTFHYVVPTFNGDNTCSYAYFKEDTYYTDQNALWKRLNETYGAKGWVLIAQVIYKIESRYNDYDGTYDYTNFLEITVFRGDELIIGYTNPNTVDDADDAGNAYLSPSTNTSEFNYFHNEDPTKDNVSNIIDNTYLRNDGTSGYDDLVDIYNITQEGIDSRYGGVSGANDATVMTQYTHANRSVKESGKTQMLIENIGENFSRIEYDKNKEYLIP